MAGVAEALASRSWPALIKDLDARIAASEAPNTRLLLNRGFLLQQIGLYRKALKDYEAALAAEPGCAAALLNKAKVHVALKQGEDAAACLEQLAACSIDPAAVDLALLLQGQQLAAALAAGEVREGAKLPLVPALPPPPPPPTAAAATQTLETPAGKGKGMAAGFLGGASAKPAAAAAVAAAAAASAGSVEAPAASGAAEAAAAAAGSSSSSSTRQQALSAPLSGKGEGTAAAAPAVAIDRSITIDPLHQLVARTDANQGVGLAVGLVNSGKCWEAEALLGLLLSHHPGNAGALAARGTARALTGRLQEAVADFGAAIEAEPCFHDFWKRRGQALTALGEDEGAARDLRQAIALAPDAAAKADCHEELGRLHHKQKDYRRAEAEFKAAVALLPEGGAATELLGSLGLCQVSQGDLQDGIATYRRALQIDSTSKDLWLNLGMALKELCDVGPAEEALRKAAKLAGGGPTAVHAYRLLAQMKQGLGDHLGAVRELNRGIAAASSELQRIELRFLRGACHHAVGQHQQAVEDYQRTLEAQGALTPDASPDLVSFVCLAFYQKEMALWARARLDRPVCSLCLDADLHPEFKELWCKKGPPSAEFVGMYRAIMQPQHPDWAAPRPAPPPAALLGPLIEAADAVGRLVQYRHQGFLPNRRQQRMAGLAAIEYAQALQQLAADRRAGKATTVPNAGASVSARVRAPRSGSHAFGWRDAMEVIVRWRQLAEPNDQVIWVDLLTEREFSAGFGSHTPMFTGQTKCVRYHMVFDRALALMKRCLQADGWRAYDAGNAPVVLDSEERRAAAAGARSASDMWGALGTDAWVVVPIHSTTRPGHHLEGTRLTIVNMAKGPAAMAEPDGGIPAIGLANGVRGEAPVPASASGADGGSGSSGSGSGSGGHKPPKTRPQPDAFEFSIRTPVTPARWADYDEELAGLFERQADALAAGDAAAAAEAALRFAYYWYNFMPLARGSAFCGYASLLGALLACGAPVRAAMPPSYQTDWEAILEISPERFLASVAAWMLPPEVPALPSLAAAARGGGGGGDGGSSEAAAPPPCKPVDQLPKVAEVLDTMRKRLEALNGPDVPRI